MKKLSLLLVFVLAFVMLFAFNVFAEDANIAGEATATISGSFWPIDGSNGTTDCRGYINDGDETTGLPSSWSVPQLDYILTFENERTVSKVVILCNGSGTSGNLGEVTDMNCSNDFTVTAKNANGDVVYTKTVNAKDQTTITYDFSGVYNVKTVVVNSYYGGWATDLSFLREVEVYEHIAAEKITASREITDEATVTTDGGGNVEATRDNDVNTAGSCGSAASWVNFHYVYSDPRTISKVVVVVNSTGDVLDANGNVVKTHTELSNLPNIYCRLYDANDSKLAAWENQPTSDAEIVTDDNGNSYAVYTFDLGGVVYNDVAKVEIATVHGGDKNLGIWEVEIYNQYEVCAEGQHNWKDATCLAPKTCVDCGTQEGELAAHTPAEDDGDCSTAVRCTVCKAVLVEAKKHVANDEGACTNDGCSRVGEINVADKAATVEPGPSTWGHVKPQYLYDNDYSTSTHAPKSTGFSYTFIYDDARLISKVVIVANGESNQPSASTSTANHAIYEVLVTLYDDKGAAVYTSEAYKFENENTVIEIVLPGTYYAYSVACTFASTEAWGNSLVREIEIYDTTVEKAAEEEEIPAPQEGCFERVDFKEYIDKTYYYTEDNGYYYVVDEDGNYILDENGNAIKYAGAPIGGNGGANPPGCELDGSSGSGYCMTWEQQYNSIQYNFKDKLLFAEITIGYKTSGNAADGYKLYIGDVVDGEEVWTLVVDFIVPEEAEWGDYLLNTFTLGEDGEGVEGTMFRFEWIPGVAIRNNPSLCEVGMLTFKNNCTWVENEVLVEGNCGYDRKANCTCSVCGVEKLVVTAASGEHNKSVVEEAKAATCTDFGYNAVKYCATCEKTFGGDRIAKALGHDMSVAATCTTPKSCSRCDYTEGEALGHKQGTAATCTEAAICSVCGESYGEALGHTEETIAAVAPTCTETGLTAGVKCSVCGETLTAQETVAALGHTHAYDFDGAYEYIGATCTTAGTYTDKCEVCGEIFVEEIPVDKEYGHEMVEGSEVTVNQTCIEDGYYSYVCKHCNETIVTVYEASEEYHGWDDGKVVDGAIVYTCSVCEATKEETFETLVVGDNSIEFPAIIHPMLGFEVAGDVTVIITVPGKYTVSSEDAWITIINGNVTEEVSEFEVAEGEFVKLGIASMSGREQFSATVTLAKEETHTHEYTAVVTAPTCTADGYTTYTCTCGDTYTDDVVDALGHTEVEIPAVLPLPSNGDVAKTAGSKCSVCGEVIVEQTDVDVTNTPSWETFGIDAVELILTNNISLNYKINVSAGYSIDYLVFIFEGEEYILDEYSTIDSQGRYIYNFDKTRPHKIDSNISAYVYGTTEDGYVVDKYDYSVMEYCIAIIGEEKPEKTTVISDLLYMGAATQKFIADSNGSTINEEDLVTSKAIALLEEQGKGYELTPSTFAGTPTGSNPKYDDYDTNNAMWQTANVLIGSSTCIEYSFTAKDIEGLTVVIEVDGVKKLELTPEELTIDSKGRYLVTVECITSIQYDCDVKATIMDGDVALGSITYSINDYLAYTCGKATGSKLDLAQAVYNFGQSAYDLFNK